MFSLSSIIRVSTAGHSATVSACQKSGQWQAALAPRGLSWSKKVRSMSNDWGTSVSMGVQQWTTANATENNWDSNNQVDGIVPKSRLKIKTRFQFSWLMMFDSKKSTLHRVYAPNQPKRNVRYLHQLRYQSPDSKSTHAFTSVASSFWGVNNH